MKNKAKWIKSSGQIIEVTPKNGKDFSLEEMTEFVGGYIEVIYPPTKTGALMICNEEGKILGLPLNPVATEIFYPGHDVVCGDVLLCHTSQIV